MEPLSCSLIAPGTAGLPPGPATSIEIYLYDVWRALRVGVDMRLYARGTVVSTVRGRERRQRLRGAKGAHYLDVVLKDIARNSTVNIVQIDNRPQYVMRARTAFPDAGIILGLHSMTFLSKQSMPPAKAALALSQASRIVVNSHYVSQRVRSAFAVKTPIVVIHPGVDTKLFHPCQSDKDQRERQQLRRRYAARHHNVVLFVGRIVPRKGLDVLLLAMREMQRRGEDVPALWVAGRLPRPGSTYRRAIDRAARRLPVRFLGYTTRHELAKLYRAADVFVCPSQKPEAFGLVNLEAQASGIPVIASDAWGIRESVRHGVTGILLEDYKSADAWASAMSSLLQDRRKRQRYGEQGVTIVRDENALDSVATAYRNLYREVAGH